MKKRTRLRRLMLGTSLGITLAFVGVGGGLLEAFSQLSHDAKAEERAAALIQEVASLEAAAIQANRASQTPTTWKRPDALLKRVLSQARAEGDEPNNIAFPYAEMKRELNPIVVGADESAFLDATRAYRVRKFKALQTLVGHGDALEEGAKAWAVWLSCVSIVALAWCMMQMWRRVFDPIFTLSQAARRFGEGELSTRSHLGGKDELSELGATFDAMATQIQERENERLRFVAGVAHDLKNPLTVIGGAAGLLRSKFDRFSPQQRDEWLAKIEGNAKRMETMIADLTDAVQGQTATLQLDLRQCDLSSLGQRALEEARLAFPAHAFNLEAPAELLAMADCRRLERVFDNLLSNAAKYSPPGKLVTLRIWKENNSESAPRVCCEVEDEGAGIAPDEAARLFQPFVRLERTSTMARGTGLGLVSVQKVVRAHGGDVWLDSELGRGSKFGFWLPFSAQPGAPSSTSPD